MANQKAQPRINFTSMSNQDFQNLLSGGNLAKPLYEFDANGNAVFHEENVPYYSPSVVLTNPFNGRSETATTIVDYVKNEEAHRKAVSDTYNALMQYNHEYNVNSTAMGAVKSLLEFPEQVAFTAGETVGNIVNAIHSTGRTMMETHWKAVTINASDSAKREMENILTELGPELGIAYVKNHDFDSDLTISDEAKNLFKNYKALLKSRDNDNLWSDVLDQTFSGARKELDKTFNPETGGNKYQTLEKFTSLGADVAGSWGVFKGAGMAAKAMTASKVGAAMAKTFGVTGKSAVYGTAFFNQYDSLRRQGLMNGLSYDEATQLAFVGAAFEAWVEGWGVSKFGRLETRKSLLNIVKSDMAPEALEEFVQTGGENVFTKIYGINNNTFTDILEEMLLSALGGALGGTASGTVDYMSGQVTSRLQAANDIRKADEEAALIASRERNKEYLEKEKNRSLEAGKQYSSTDTTQTSQETQEGPEMAQETSAPQLPYNEKRLLLEHDKAFAQEMANAQEKFRATLKEVLSEKLTKANPKISEEQIENATALLFRVANRLDNNDSYSAALSSWAEDIVKWSNEKAPQYSKNLADLDAKFGIETLGLSTQDVADFKSNNRITRQKAQWKAAKLAIKTDLKMAGVSDQMASKLSDSFESVFSTTAFLANVSPVELYRKLAPKIIGLSRASINGQTIEGYQGILDSLPVSTRSTGSLQRIEAENILRPLYDTQNTDSAKNNKEVALNELFRGQELKKNISAEEVAEALDNRARMESALAKEMGISYGNDLDFNDYRIMGLMRARGATQTQINEAFAIENRLDPEQEFDDARKKLFPKLDSDEIKQSEKLLKRANIEKANSNVKGLFAPEGQASVSEDAGKTLEEAEFVGGTVLLGADVGDKVAAEEFFHSISVKLEEAAKIQAIKDSGKRLFAAYDIYSMGLLPETRPLAKLFDYISRPLNGVELTDRQLHETLADAFVNHISLEIMPQVEKEALNHNDAERNDVLATAEDSKYQGLSDEQKKSLGERFTNLLNPESGAEMIRIGNKIVNAGGNFDVISARNLALDTLSKYEVYNDSQWAYLLANMDSMMPEDQLDLLQNFGANLIQQGYDSFVAETYNVEFDENQKQVLIRKAYNDSSFFTETQPDSIYYHSEPIKPSKNITLYSQAESWWDKTKNFAKKTFNFEPIISDYIETLSHSAFKADPIIGSTLRRAMFKFGQREIAMQKLAAKIPQLAEKYKLDIMSEEKRPAFIANFKNVLLAGNPDARAKAKAWITEQFAGTGVMAEVSKTMDDIYKALDTARDELIAKGVAIGFVKEYWPRYVKDREGLAEYFGHNQPMNSTEKNIRDLVDRLKKEFKNSSIEEINRMAIDAINKQWHKYEMGEDVPSFHQRGNYFTANTSDFYDDPFETLARYFENVNRTLLMRELTGRVMPSMEEADSYSTAFDKALLLYKSKPTTAVFKEEETGKLGKAFALALTNKNPNWEALDNFARKMKLFVNKVGTQRSEFSRFWERTNSLLLGSPISVLNQFNELPLILSTFGIEATNDAIKEAVEEILSENKEEGAADLENIYVQPLQELLRYRDNDMLAKLTEMAHTISGFSGADILLKNIEIKACLKSAQKVLKSGNVNDIKYKRFMRLFNNTFPEMLYDDDTRKTIFEDLRAGNLTENVKFFAFNYLSNVQPINMAEVPTGYLNAGSLGRLVYQYHTTPLRQLEYVADDIRAGFKELPLKDAIKNLMGYLMYFVAIGVPVAVLQNLLRGRKTNLAEAAIYSPFQMLSINEYTISSIRQKGVFSGVMEQLAPSFRIGDDVTKDVLRMVSFQDYKGHAVKDVPVAGPFVYYWLLGGREYSIRHGEALLHDSESDERRSKALKFIGA